MSRKFPERLTPTTLRLSMEYMGRESAKWERSVEGWVRLYLRRNGIPSRVEEVQGEETLRIDFQSNWRQKFFVLKANAEFPYFEFV